MKKIHYGWFIVLACCAISCCNALVMQVSANFYMPVAEELGVGIGKLTIYVTIMSLTMALMFPTVGKYLEQYLKPMLLLGGVLQLLAMALMSAFSNVYLFWAAGLFIGVGAAITMSMSIPILINMWFVEKRGFAMGLALSFMGVAATVLNLLAGSLIGGGGWRMAYLALSVCVAVVYFPAILFLVKTPQQKGVQPYGVNSTGADNSTEVAAKTATNGMTMAQAIKHPAFYCMLVCAATLAAASSEATQVSAFCTGHFGLSIEAGASMLAILSVGVMLGNVVMGIIDDKAGHIVTWLLAIDLILLSQIVLIANMTAMLMISVFVFGFATTIYTVLLPLMTDSIFGGADYSKIWGYIMSAGSILGAIIVPIYGTIFDITGSYSLVFILVAVLTVICGTTGALALKIAKK